MKKLILTSLSIIMFSFSPPEIDSTSKKQNKISPPSWIIGTWKLQDGNHTGFRFTKNDFCVITSPTQQKCNRELVKAFNKSGGYTEVNESVTDNSYTIVVTINNLIETYSFKKVSSSEISWTNSLKGNNPIYVKQ